eukprot:1622088-Rhodomonas_salina.4
MGQAVLRQAMLLRHVRYSHRICSYATRGTDLAHGAVENCAAQVRLFLCEIKPKKPHFWYSLHGECGLFHLISAPPKMAALSCEKEAFRGPMGAFHGEIKDRRSDFQYSCAGESNAFPVLSVPQSGAIDLNWRRQEVHLRVMDWDDMEEECGTDIAYGATRCPCGADLAYAATRCTVLTSRVVLRAVRYRARVWCYAKCGTKLGYGGTRRRRNSRWPLTWY